MTNNDIISNTKAYICSFIKFIILSTIVGIICGGIGIIFHELLSIATNVRENNSILLYTLPICGIIIAWLYNKLKMQNNTGTNYVFEAVREGSDVSIKLFPLIFTGTLLTHLGGGSSGREGAALQVGASVSSYLSKIAKLDENDRRIMILCGMSAVFTAMFGTPITATFFVIEVINIGSFNYFALLPCLTSSLVAYYLSNHICGIEPLWFTIPSIPEYLSISTVFSTILLAIGCAVVSICLCIVLKKTSKTLKEHLTNPYIRIVVGSLIVILTTKLLGSYDYNGAGMNVIERAINGHAVWYAFIVKMLLTSITLGSGFKGGEIVPTMFIGATFGCAFGGILGLNPGFGAAIGLVAVFCGAVNCPISSIILSIEVFGTSSLLYFVIACSISFILSGKYSLYSAQRHIYSKHKPIYNVDVNKN